MSVRRAEGDAAPTARWLSTNGAPAPTAIVPVGDDLTAADAYRLAADRTSMLWRGDFQNARQLLTALARRVDRPRSGGSRQAGSRSIRETFDLYRQDRARRARLLARLVVPVEAGHVVPLRRAPDVREALAAAVGPLDEPAMMPLRELLGAVSAHEWRRTGVEVPALGARIHPHFGVFAPVRGEYVDLVAEAPLPSTTRAFDIGTGTGVLTAVLLARGVQSVVATDSDDRALACAAENLTRLGHADRVELVRTDLFPQGRSPLVVCNPPWLPGKPRSPLDHAVYDPGGRMLRGFLDRLGRHLEPAGEGWLVLSDLAERLELRSRDDLLAAVHAAGLEVIARSDTRPRHPRASDTDDPLHAARSAEITSLWRLGIR